MKTTSCLFFIFLFTCNAHSQFIEQWQHRYNGPANSIDAANDIIVDDTKNIYVTGNSIGIGTSQDFSTVKYNPSGLLLWAVRYSGFNNDVDNSNAIALDNQGFPVVTGFSFSNGTSYDFTTIKYDPSGNELWVKKYNGNGNGIDRAKSIVCDDAGNVYITGESYGGIQTSYDFATVKYNSSGIQQWSVRYNGAGNGNDAANSVTIDNQYNVYVTGQSYGIGSNLDITTVKYNSSGVQQWVMTYNGPANDADIGNKILIDNQSNLFAAGYSRGNGSSYDYTIIKYDVNGNEQWVYRFNGPQNSEDILSSAALDNSGNIYATGVVNNDVTGVLADYATIKCSSSGSLQWTAFYNGPANNNDAAVSIAINNTGDIFVTGKSKGIGFDYATVRYNSSGVQQNVIRYNGDGNSDDIPSAITTDNHGNIHVTGSSIGSSSSNDFFTLKYTLMTGVNQNSFSPDMFVLNQNYPNPFNPVTKLEFGVPVWGYVTLKIYDINGKLVSTPVNENKSAGFYSINFNGINLSGGIYFYELRTENFSEVRKMILVK